MIMHWLNSHFGGSDWVSSHFGIDDDDDPLGPDRVDAGGTVNISSTAFGIDEPDDPRRVDVGGSVNFAPAAFGFDPITLGIGGAALLSAGLVGRKLYARRGANPNHSTAPGGHGPVHGPVHPTPSSDNVYEALQIAAATDPYALGRPL
jgi:hypothetical protein